MRFSNRRLVLENLEGRRLLAAVDIPDNLSGSPAQVVVAPINIDTAAGVRGVEIRLSYDTSRLDLTSAGVIAGSIWSGSSDTQVTANVDDASGTAIIFVAASNPLGSGSGSLVELNFTIRAGVDVGTTAAIDLTEVVLNEGQIATAPAPIVGLDPTDGLITVSTASGTNRIGGFVYADTNTNSLPDSQEGISGVMITLVDQASGAQRQTVTEADGSFEFVDLATGTYTLTEQQPAAYLDGGTNTVTVTVSTEASLGDQNFRELGLRPEYVYGRLLTTLVRPVGSQGWIETLDRIHVDANESAVASLSVLSTSVVSSSSEMTSLSTSESFVSPSIDDSQTSNQTANSEPLEEATAALMIQPTSVVNSFGQPPRRDEFSSESVDRVYTESILF
ncbi:SdrD B-like domain-containing protein [Neorhodopirellula pilleata]|uniref:Serine-aspartate repeat-containing protein D n=1 Tax=Neorhodopirellula pilleata TaxID=2714738 RepID=A0A5C6AGZ4_9BACT|nr:SdrD B-like domain-containing protein [Neorhodopirellula pilleata]TWT98720.1 Serine-aspartate repeat-containing protein D precursor [Neorhodopirellula pilleata]